MYCNIEVFCVVKMNLNKFIGWKPKTIVWFSIFFKSVFQLLRLQPKAGILANHFSVYGEYGVWTLANLATQTYATSTVKESRVFMSSL
jgi:hypothetical protein